MCALLPLWLSAQPKAYYYAQLSERATATVAEALRQAPGVKLHYRLDWHRGAVIVADSTAAAALSQTAGIGSVEWIGSVQGRPALRLPHRRWDDADAPLPHRHAAGALHTVQARLALPDDHGPAGPPVRIAVLDGGFYGYDRHPYLHGIADRLLGTYDFVDADSSVAELSAHGTKVLALLAGAADHRYRAAAAGARYLLLRTEDVYQENPVELYHFMAALEAAAAHNVQLVHASLGYYLEATPANDRHRGRLARSLERALAANMLIVTSGGNRKNHPVGIPADHPGVLAVGALDLRNRPAVFSSRSGSKPELGAPGVRVPVVSTYGTGLHLATGSSYGAPLVTALAARLWAARPGTDAATLKRALLESRAATVPGDAIFGLPSFERALRLLGR